jgi:predicted methyltransferase MtxX (methanogen marker protein 4)
MTNFDRQQQEREYRVLSDSLFVRKNVAKGITSRTLDGTHIHASASSQELTLVQRASACLVERRVAFLLSPKGMGEDATSFDEHISTRQEPPDDPDC